MARQPNTVVVLHPVNSDVVTLDICLQLDASSGSVWRKNMARSEDEAAVKTIERLQILLVQQKGEKKGRRVTRDELLKVAPPIEVFALEGDEAEVEGQAITPATTLLKPLDASVSNNVFWKQAKQMLIGSTAVKVKYNVPTITSVVPPPALYVGVPAVCSGVTTLFTSELGIRYEWCLCVTGADEHASIRVISTDAVFTPLEEHVGKSLLLRVSPEGDSGLWTQVELPPVLAALPPMDRWKHTLQPAEAPAFRVVTYNVLHDEFCSTNAAKRRIYPFATDDILSLEYRQSRIVQELLAYKADVICLQECGKKVYQQFFERVLRHSGYDGRYTNKSGGVKEGCACFWRRTRFCMGEALDFPLNLSTLQEDHPELGARVSLYPEFREALEHVTSIGALVLLRDLHTKEELLVGNTHLFYHANACHIRLLQTYMLLHKLKLFAASRPCVVLCGDFNFTHTTGGYRLVTRGQTGVEHPSWKKGELFYWGCDRMLGVSTEETEMLEEGGEQGASSVGPATEQTKRQTPLEAFRETLEAPLQLTDAYDATGENLPWSNYTMTFREVIDYIFFAPTRLSVLRTVPIPPESEISENVALPNRRYPSDHLALIADLAYTSNPPPSQSPASPSHTRCV
ncbi:2,5-phosphodiesterase [Trypanosoma conorhini]|uniref:2,5-phosphodiesterase n=1 Tax=Trypanosoma conorhini TaxID=83891 RepID=A0A422PRZ7_9TRYP|nr:2,5-phosphodiesterase [Trypanosoma conorhini]RNF20509.1 2,5-phosphodiesterase [Trypanosoma conorhini]